MDGGRCFGAPRGTAGRRSSGQADVIVDAVHRLVDVAPGLFVGDVAPAGRGCRSDSRGIASVESGAAGRRGVVYK